MPPAPKMYIPFLAKQKTNAWQLAVLPCVFGMLFYCIGWYDSNIALMSVAMALLGFVLTGGLRACAMGLCLWLGYIAAFEQSKRWTALAVGLIACTLVFLVRILLPKKVLSPDARANFRSFFWIAGTGMAGFCCFEIFLFLLGK